MKQQAYIFIGPPGSGKGSLSKLCSVNLGWHQLSTGNLCRKHISEQTPIGKEIDFIIKSGKLISDELVTSMVDYWLSETTRGDCTLILDGYPRNVTQVKSLLNLVQDKYQALNIQVIRFIVSDEIAFDRICNRYICQNNECQAVFSGNFYSGLSPKKESECDHCSGKLGKRSDDAREIVLGRLKMYREFEHSMLACFSNREVIDVDVERPLEEIFETFKLSVKEA